MNYNVATVRNSDDASDAVHNKINLKSSHSMGMFPLQTQISPKKVKDVVHLHSGSESIVSNILTLVHKQPINNNQLTKQTHIWTVSGSQSTRRHS